MPIPDYDAGGVLPPGVHLCTMDEIKERFARFRTSDRRLRLYRQLVEYVDRVEEIGAIRALIIDGSFVTDKAEPADIDLIVIVSDTLHAAPGLSPYVYNVISKRQVKKKFDFDLFIVRDGSEELQKQVEFFSQVRGRPATRKGLLRVDL
ncbi:MAG TPA: hypothetical protein VH988_30045 [Thermoanaerobaculia bacterium]|jgi:hypothetical protein|nr:hypothetical protein [Thermoanaerobaculia bacterium]